MGDTGADTEAMYGEGGPLAYGYESDFKVINNGAKYYPIELYFTGNKPEDFDHMRFVNYKQTVTFNPFAKEYQ